MGIDMLMELLGDGALIAISAYLIGRNQFISDCIHTPHRPRCFLTLVAVFSSLAIIGTYNGIPVEGAPAPGRKRGRWCRERKS